MTKILTADDLRQFTGTENWWRHPLCRKVLYTDGAKHVAEAGHAYWLLDIIAFAQAKPAVAAQEFQVWRLTVNPDHTALLVCEDGNYNPVYQQALEFTDFPLPKIELFFTNHTIYLPSEH